MSFTLTPAAERFIRLMVRVDGGPDSGFRLRVTPGGCSGLSAEVGVTAMPSRDEAVVELNGMKLFLSAETRVLLEGVTVDFVDTAAQTGLVFHDPKGFSCASGGGKTIQ